MWRYYFLLIGLLIAMLRQVRLLNLGILHIWCFLVSTVTEQPVISTLPCAVGGCETDPWNNLSIYKGLGCSLWTQGTCDAGCTVKVIYKDPCTPSEAILSCPLHASCYS